MRSRSHHDLLIFRNFYQSDIRAGVIDIPHAGLRCARIITLVRHLCVHGRWPFPQRKSIFDTAVLTAFSGKVHLALPCPRSHWIRSHPFVTMAGVSRAGARALRTAVPVRATATPMSPLETSNLLEPVYAAIDDRLSYVRKT